MLHGSQRTRIRQSLLCVAPLIAILAASARNASAQTTATTYNFCFVPLTGTTYRIGTPETRPTCSSTSHIPFSITDGAGALRPGSAAGGDLEGALPNPQVSGLQGRPVSANAPTVGQMLMWNGSAWVPANPPSGGEGAPQPPGGYVQSADPAVTYTVVAAGRVAGGFTSQPTLGGLRVVQTFGDGRFKITFNGYVQGRRYIIKVLPDDSRPMTINRIGNDPEGIFLLARGIDSQIMNAALMIEISEIALRN